MERNFLDEFGLEEDVIQKILDENSRELAQKEYAHAVAGAAGEKGLKFTSKAAERDFIAQLTAKGLELKDGELVGLDGFIQEQREADPYAFAPDRPLPRFVAPAGIAGPSAVPANVARAREMGAEKAAALKTSSEVMKYFL